jgi:NAD(P) transhydrogenase subunit alpha
MLIGVPLERTAGETRVAATPDTVRKLVAQGHEVIVERGAGEAAHQPDAAYVAAAARIVGADDALAAQLVLRVRPLDDEELKKMRRGSVLVGMLNPFDANKNASMAACGITAFALEAAPRTTRAQSMDVLSSQANVAGYRAVVLAASLYQRFFPMLMTAAGTVKAARVLVLGAGVAGLQAIATAKRMGAVVEASDVRPVAKEQIESLGAKFLDVPFMTEQEREIAQGVGGYARPMPADWLHRQAELVHERAKVADIVVTTALIPGRPAPVLLTELTIKEMKPGSVVIDLAAGRGLNGGNCPLSEADSVVTKHGVVIAGLTNLAAMVSADASALYARNVLDFVSLIVTKDGAINIDMGDEIVASCLICRDGKLHRSL